MPTAGRLTGAVFYAALGAALAFLLVPYFDEARAPKYWIPLVIAVGVLVGWMVVGSRSGQGTGAAIGTGLTGAAALAFWVLLLVSGYDMIQVAMRGRFDGPMDAVIGVFSIMLDYAKSFYSPLILFVWIGGGLIAGLVTDLIGSRYR
ncbi:TrgA family protein [Loktanella sp. R86503]|uniref:TrgA family protein n=1 Tax=Loktanella TaxID=245186 RepID=UPI0036DF4AD3